jgi:hypothetical protein
MSGGIHDHSAWSCLAEPSSNIFNALLYFMLFSGRKLQAVAQNVRVVPKELVLGLFPFCLSRRRFPNGIGKKFLVFGKLLRYSNR